MNIDEVVGNYPEISGIHPACLAIPPLPKSDLAALSVSIRDNGLANEILLTESSELLDGRHRLMCCLEHNKEPRFKTVFGDPWNHVIDQNIAHRHLTVGQRAIIAQAWQDAERSAAKERQERKPADSVVVMSPQQNGKSRDRLAERFGVGGSAIDKAAVLLEYLPELAADVHAGTLPLEPAYQEAKKARDTMLSHGESTNDESTSASATVEDEYEDCDDEEDDDDTIEQSKPKEQEPSSVPQVTLITHDGVVTKLDAPKKVVFNKTNDSVDWAAWTWNPVTGCNHGCDFCYAREIALSKRMQPYYPNGFKPTFHEYRLAAPANTKCPATGDDRDSRVFVGSMADLFGKWVPKDWIQKVFEACQESPDWEYLFLTKWPARYAKLPLLDQAWYGASVTHQRDVTRVEKAMRDFETDCVKWISLEPMLSPIEFEDLSWCNIVVIGGQTSTVQPSGHVAEFAPDFDWVVDVVNQCRDAGVPYYIKANLGLAKPGMKLPKPGPFQ